MNIKTVLWILVLITLHGMIVARFKTVGSLFPRLLADTRLYTFSMLSMSLQSSIVSSTSGTTHRCRAAGWFRPYRRRTARLEISFGWYISQSAYDLRSFHRVLTAGCNKQKVESNSCWVMGTHHWFCVFQRAWVAKFHEGVDLSVSPRQTPREASLY